MSFKKIMIPATILAMSSNVMAGGFEKVVQWSAKWSGVAGAATGAVKGADALYFNPAGLARGESTNNLSLNTTLTQSQFEGPVATDNIEIKSKPKNSILPGFLYSRKLNSKFAVGVGYYVAGGTGADFDGVQFDAARQQNPQVETDINLVEYAIGAAYNFTNEFSFGAAYRYAKAQGLFKGGSFAGGAAIESQYLGLEDEQSGFKAGVQYIQKDGNWGAGFSYRSELGLKLEGDGRVSVNAGANQGGITGTSVLENDFPSQWSLGGFYTVNDALTIYGDVTFTDYSVNKTLGITTDQEDTFGVAALAAVANTAGNTAIEQEWDDQWNYKIGAEYKVKDITYRGGYALTTAVVPENRARATFSSPGTGHTLVGGLGIAVNEKHMFDVAIDHSWASGENDDNTNEPIGEYSSSATSFYTSYVVNF